MWELIVKGKIFMIPMLACSVFALAVMIERFRVLRAAGRESAVFLQQFDRLIQRGDMAGATAFCEKSNHALAEMMLAGLRRYAELRHEKNTLFVHEQVNHALEEQGRYTVAELESNLSVLATIATIAPLLGLASTVTGMIRAFNAIAAANDIKVSLVASGIAEALINTAAGLMIAIPSVVAFNWFTRQVEGLTLPMEASANGLLRAITDSARHSSGAPEPRTLAEPVIP